MISGKEDACAPDKGRLDMEIEELRLLMVKMSQRKHEERMNIFIRREKKQSIKRG